MIRSNCRFTLKPNGRVFMRVRSKDIKDTTIGLEVFAEKSKWDNQRAKDRSVHNVNGKFYPARVINNEIEKAEQVTKAYFSYCELNKITPDSKTLYEKLERELKPTEVKKAVIETAVEEDSKLPPFNTIFEKFKTEMSLEKNWGKKTYCLYQHLWHQLTSYKENVKSEEIDKKFMNQFKGYLIEQKYENVTINRRFRCLKTILRWAREQGYQVNEEALTYHSNLKEPRKDIVFLKYNEVEKMENHVFPESKKYLDRARDFFCFMCYTGLRYSDLKNLKKAAINGDYIDHSFTEKTTKNIKVPLLPKAKKLIEKYINSTFGELVFPVPSNQKLNKYIQEAAKEVGLDREFMETHFSGSNRTSEARPLHEMVSCHTGRKTFVCISLKVGMAQNVVMKITGHADYNAMRPYIESCDDTVRDEMSKWEKLSSNKSDLHSMLRQMIAEQLKELSQYAKVISERKPK